MDVPKVGVQAIVSNKYFYYAVGSAIVVLLVIIGLIKTFTPPRKTIETSIHQTGVVVQQSYDGALPLRPIDQDKYRKIIQEAWENALVKGATNITTFPKDPNLIAFTYKPHESATTQSFVLYRNRPITIRTKKVLELTGGAPYKITLSSADYALVVTFEYTDAVKELNVDQTLKEAFAQAVMGKGSSS